MVRQTQEVFQEVKRIYVVLEDEELDLIREFLATDWIFVNRKRELTFELEKVLKEVLERAKGEAN